MSNYFINAPLIKNLYINNIVTEKEPKKKSKSQLKYIKASDIMTQAKPSYLNNFILPINSHESSLTPTNHSNKLNSKKEFLLPEKSEEYSDKKTLILDLDETLVHSSFTPFEKNDIILEVDFEGILYNIYVKVRPYAEQFLKNVSKLFEIVIFTASISKYASPLLDILDKESNITFRLFREHCTYINGIFIKDLKRLNRNLKDVIIVDNSPIAYAFDSENGLPIKTWYEDPYDTELKKIEPLIVFLSKTKDVRIYIDKFVDDNEILYSKAMSIINQNETDKDDINSSDKENNNSDNEDDINIIEKFKMNDYKLNTLNLMKNKKFNLFSFNNITNINNHNTKTNSNNNMSSRKLENKKLEKEKEKENTSINNKIDIINESENTNNINFQTNNNNINNNINNKNNSKNKNKKPNIGILLRKESSKKKNIFRLSQKSDNNVLFNLKINKNNNGIINKNFATNSFNNNNNENHLIPLVLPFSNTVKNVLGPKKTFFNQTNNKINIIPILMNMNMTKNDSVENKKKIKYTNLADKEKNGKNFAVTDKNFKLIKNVNINAENKKISTSIGNSQGMLPIGLKKNDKKYDLLQIPKSNSINDVLKFNRLGNNINKHLEAKTPNRHLLNIGKENNYNYNINFGQKLGKKNMLFNLIKGIGISKTGRSKNASHSANPNNLRSYSKSSQRPKNN